MAAEAIPEAAVEVEEVSGSSVGVVDLAAAREVEPDLAVAVGFAADVKTDSVEIEDLPVVSLANPAWSEYRV